MKKHTMAKLESMCLRDLQAKYREVIGEATRCPNRKYLVRRISEAQAATTTTPARGRFASMTVDELQRRYEQTVGRPTGSSDKRYLIWKIREAEKGRVPVGPRVRSRAAENGQVLPFRLHREAITRLDEAWRARGMASRAEFFRTALAHYLESVGASSAAAAVRGE
jgi:hypothetical protein